MQGGVVPEGVDLYLRDPEGEIVDGSEAGERLGQTVDDDGVRAEQSVERRSKYELSFVQNVGVLVGKADLRRLRTQFVGGDGGVTTAPAHPRHQLAGAVAAARLEDEENDKVEDALAGHDDEDGADAGQLQAEIVVVARHAQCAAVVCTASTGVVSMRAQMS